MIIASLMYLFGSCSADEIVQMSTIFSLKNVWVVIIWKFTDSNGCVDSHPYVVTKKRKKQGVELHCKV